MTDIMIGMAHNKLCVDGKHVQADLFARKQAEEIDQMMEMQNALCRLRDEQKAEIERLSTENSKLREALARSCEDAREEMMGCPLSKDKKHELEGFLLFWTGFVMGAGMMGFILFP